MEKIDRLYSLLRKQNQENASITVRSQATIYQNTIKFFFARKPWKKLQPGMELRPESKKLAWLSSKPSPTPEENQLRSQRRTKKLINGIVFNNTYDAFATFTFAKERQDIKKCKAKMNNWRKSQIKIVGHFEALFVLEFHGDKESLHFHALLKGYKGELREAINPHTGLPLKNKRGQQVYTIPSFQSGFTNAVRLDGGQATMPLIAAYLYKYVTKSSPLPRGMHHFWATAGLKRPPTIDNPPFDFDGVEPIWEKESERGLTLIFPIKQGVKPHGQGQDS